MAHLKGFTTKLIDSKLPFYCNELSFVPELIALTIANLQKCLA
jgi:hypothetical protein